MANVTLTANQITDSPSIPKFHLLNDIASTDAVVKQYPLKSASFECSNQIRVDVSNIITVLIYHEEFPEWDITLQWRHNGRDGVSNHQPDHCLFNRLFRRISKKTPKLRVTGFCEGNSPVTGEFPAQRASNAENVSIWWRHHEIRVNVPNIITMLIYHEEFPQWDITYRSLMLAHQTKTHRITRENMTKSFTKPQQWSRNYNLPICV